MIRTPAMAERDRGFADLLFTASGSPLILPGTVSPFSIHQVVAELGHGRRGLPSRLSSMPVRTSVALWWRTDHHSSHRTDTSRAALRPTRERTTDHD